MKGGNKRYSSGLRPSQGECMEKDRLPKKWWIKVLAFFL